jgi:hypothetical protein
MRAYPRMAILRQCLKNAFLLCFCIHLQLYNISMINPLEIGPVAPFGPIPYPPIHRPKAPDLICDQRYDIRLLYEIGWSYSQIHDHLLYCPTIRQIKYVYSMTNRATPRKRGGRCPVLM